MADLSRATVNELVSKVAGNIPDTLRVAQPLDLTGSNYRLFTVPNVAQVFTPDLSKGGGQLVVGTAAAFQIANPINVPAGDIAGWEMQLCIVNTSGGALGAITGDTQYRLSGAAFPTPATGNRWYITFTNVGTQVAPIWSETGRSATQTPN